MTKFADYSEAVFSDQLHNALVDGGFDAVCHYLGDDFALRIENPLVVYAIRARGWTQMGIFVPRLASVDGAADARRARDVYLFPAGTLMWLDIEPSEFDAAPTAWARAADGWCDEIRAGGLSPGVYGVDRTVAACGNHADRIWRAVPGFCDPAGAGPQGLSPAYKPGDRAIQCDQGSWDGVSMDISFSQFDVPRGEIMTQDEFNAFMDNWLARQGMGLADLDALRWRVEALVSGSPTVQGGPTKGEVNATAAGAGLNAATALAKIEGALQGAGAALAKA